MRTEVETSGNETKCTELVTIKLANQTLGIPVLAVHDVLKAQKMTSIPLSPPSVAGVLNLRGRIVTAIDLRLHLGFKPRGEDEPSMSVVIEHKGEPYSLVIDKVGEVLSLPDTDFERNPATLDERLRDVSSGIFRLKDELLVVLNVDVLLDHQASDAA